MSNSPYATSFSLKTLDHLGINLYGNVPAVIAEMVANAHDAAARRVDITISPGKIVVQDDGVGMSLVDINTKYLRFGYEKRREVTIVQVSDGDRTVQRHVMGRKGIGKISALSIAREVEVQTVHGNERNGFIIDLDIIRQLQEINSTEYLPTPLPTSAIVISQGTRIELRQLVDQVTGLDNTLRESLARMFPETGREVLFDIYVNGSPITTADRKWFEKVQFMWYFGQDSEKFTTYCPRLEKSFLVDDVVDLKRGYTVSGWLATTFTPSDVAIDQKIVPVYAQNKMIQRDILYDYKNYKISSSYLIGEIYAPFMDVDTAPDIILSDRQRINPNDPRYIALRQHVVQQVEAIDKVWNALRGESPNRRSRKKKTDKTQPSPGVPEQPDLFNPHLAPENNAPQPMPAEPLLEPPPSNRGNGTDNNNTANGTGDNQNLHNNGMRGNGADFGGESGGNQGVRPPPPPSREAQTAFTNIRTATKNSVLEQDFKDIILYDLDQARFSYYNRAYKACVIVLGSVVEGLMLGTLRRTEAMELILNDPNPPALFNNTRKFPGGLQNPLYSDRSRFAEALTNLTFDEMRTIFHHYIPQISQLGILDIQRFRNAVHPWRCIHQPDVYRNYSYSRALQHLMALEILTNLIINWNL